MSKVTGPRNFAAEMRAAFAAHNAYEIERDEFEAQVRGILKRAGRESLVPEFTAAVEDFYGNLFGTISVLDNFLATATRATKGAQEKNVDLSNSR